MEKYIGPYKIATEDKLDKETTKVTFEPYTAENGNSFQPPERIYTHKKLKQITTKTATDFNTLMKNMYSPLVEDIVKLLVEYDVNIGFRENKANDLEYVFKLVERKIVNWRDTYEDRLWGAEEDEKTLRDLVKGLASTSDSIRELKVVQKIPRDPE